MQLPKFASWMVSSVADSEGVPLSGWVARKPPPPALLHFFGREFSRSEVAPKLKSWQFFELNSHDMVHAFYQQYINSRPPNVGGNHPSWISPCRPKTKQKVTYKPV